MKKGFSFSTMDRLKMFYILTFFPLLAIEFYRLTFFGDALGVLIPLYGFLLLFFKKDKLFDYLVESHTLQKMLGLALVLASFFVFYALVPSVPWAGFYGVANYAIYLVGMIFIFFKLSVFKKAFTSFFVIVASASVGLAFRWIEFQISSTVPYYVYLFSSILGVFGIKNTLSNPTTILLYTPSGTLPVLFEAGCIGVYSLLIFSILLVVAMVETSASKRTKILWSLAGLIGVFFVNILRLLILIASIYFYGYDIGQQVHQVIGYVLFLTWLGLFLLLFTKRQTILGKIQLVQRKILAWL